MKDGDKFLEQIRKEREQRNRKRLRQEADLLDQLSQMDRDTREAVFKRIEDLMASVYPGWPEGQIYLN